MINFLASNFQNQEIVRDNDEDDSNNTGLSITPLASGPPESWGRDLELMHHYCTITSGTFAHQESACHVWRFIFPQEGYAHAFVTHGVLSLAALHKAHLLPSKRHIYLARSAYHHAIGQKDFRALLFNVTDENWRPVYCFAAIVVGYVLLSSAGFRDVSTASPIQRTSELFLVTRGIKAILLPFLERLSQTDLAPLLQTVWMVPKNSLPRQFVFHPCYLSPLVLTYS